MQMTFHRKLPIPQEVKKEFPLTEHMKQVKAARDEAINAVFDGSSDKFILIVGPCSADHSEPVLEYISRLLGFSNVTTLSPGVVNSLRLFRLTRLMCLSKSPLFISSAKTSCRYVGTVHERNPSFSSYAFASSFGSTIYPIRNEGDIVLENVFI